MRHSRILRLRVLTGSVAALVLVVAGPAAQAQAVAPTPGPSQAHPAPTAAGVAAREAPRADPAAKVPTFGDADVVVPAEHVATLIGTAVVGATGAEMGRIGNFLAQDDGRVRAVVVQWGGIAGLGSRQSVVPIERLQLGPASVSGLARLDMSRDELAEMPRYDRDNLDGLARQHGWGEGLRPVR